MSVLMSRVRRPVTTCHFEFVESFSFPEYGAVLVAQVIGER